MSADLDLIFRASSSGPLRLVSRPDDVCIAYLEVGGISAKVRRSAPGKEIQNQSHTKTALNQRSAELWRQKAKVRETRAAADVRRCGALAKKPAVISGLGRSESRRRMFASGRLAERVSVEQRLSIVCPCPLMCNH